MSDAPAGRRRPMRRLAELIPEAAAALGLEEELRTARAMATWQRLVAERVPAASASTELLAFQPGVLVVSAAAPIVAQELRLRADELLAAFAQASGGTRFLELRVVLRPLSGSSGRRGSGV
ncbi:MAG: DUF721 domain-containing protein [Chloroflexi bacterium]|nr:DUF721 domain-containing protein [Chloroflexota bacterium]